MRARTSGRSPCEKKRKKNKVESNGEGSKREEAQGTCYAVASSRNNNWENRGGLNTYMFLPCLSLFLSLEDSRVSDSQPWVEIVTSVDIGSILPYLWIRRDSSSGSSPSRTTIHGLTMNRVISMTLVYCKRNLG